MLSFHKLSEDADYNLYNSNIFSVFSSFNHDKWWIYKEEKTSFQDGRLLRNFDVRTPQTQLTSDEKQSRLRRGKNYSVHSPQNV